MPMPRKRVFDENDPEDVAFGYEPAWLGRRMSSEARPVEPWLFGRSSATRSWSIRTDRPGRRRMAAA